MKSIILFIFQLIMMSSTLFGIGLLIRAYKIDSGELAFRGRILFYSSLPILILIIFLRYR